jgi:hypothetical protein
VGVKIRFSVPFFGSLGGAIMPLSEECQIRIKNWLDGHPASDHTLDWDRWYDFVDQYSKDHGCSLNESEVREFIHKAEIERNGNVGDVFSEMINTHISHALHILYFLDYAKR